MGDDILGPDIDGDPAVDESARNRLQRRFFGKDPQPFHKDDYVVMSADSRGVHINSCIPNQAFYLLAQYLGGGAWERAGQIWYDTMQAINNPMATFADWADKTVEMAQQRYGTGSTEAIFTRRMRKLVGVNF